MAVDDRPTRVRWLVFALACAASWLLYLHRYAWGVIKPWFAKEHPHLSATELGWLDGAFNATYALGQVPGGLAGDLLGPRSVLTSIIGLWSLTVAGMGWAAGFWPMFGIRAAFGLAQAGAYPVLSKVTRSWFPLAVRTSVQGTVGALGRLGAACSSLLVSTLFIGLVGLSWQVALLAIALPGAALALAFGILFRNTPCEHPWTNRAEQEQIEGSEPAKAAGVSRRLRLDGPTLFSLSLLLLYAFASSFADMLFVFWIPTFLIQDKGLSTAEMGLFTPLPLVGGALGGVCGGMLNDVLLRQTSSLRWARSSVGFTGKCIAAGLMVASLQVADGRLVMVVLLVSKFFGDWSLPTQWGAVTDLAGPAAGTVFGAVNTVGAIGATVAGPVLGYLMEQHGWDGLFLGVASVYLVAAICWLGIDCSRRLVVQEAVSA